MVPLSTGRATVLRRAAVRATLAPSVHNTQPWRLHLRERGLDVWVDRTRQLAALDPTSRQMIISVGCAVMNARVSAAGDGLGIEVHRLADEHRPDLLASLVPSSNPVDSELAALDDVIELRQTNRGPFAQDEVPPSLIAAIERAAEAEGASLFVVRGADQRAAVARLRQHAEAVENLNPAYRAELRAWTTDDPGRRDGVPGRTGPQLERPGDESPPVTRSTDDQCLVLLCTNGDGPTEWLRAGEALERMLLEITRRGFSASPLTAVTEVPSARAQLREQLGLIGYPHLLLQIGRAPATPSSRRRRLVDVLLEDH